MTNDVTFELVHSFVLEYWRTGEVPASWIEGLLKILPKKGDLSNPKNYRGIMLLEVSYKIIANIIKFRLNVVSETLDHET